ncbi:hypothetical protein HDU81_001810 [Chytriomyces hyalinus]|nr:hypothetical protein HDU81_001810 [Chytriomyces hyalinus]
MPRAVKINSAALVRVLAAVVLVSVLGLILFGVSEKPAPGDRAALRPDEPQQAHAGSSHPAASVESTSTHQSNISLSYFEDLRTSWLESAFTVTSLSHEMYGSIHQKNDAAGPRNLLTEPTCLLTTQLLSRYEGLKQGTHVYQIVLDLGERGGAWDHLASVNLGAQLIRFVGWIGENRVSFKVTDGKDEVIDTLLEFLGKCLPRLFAVKEVTRQITLTRQIFCLSDVLELAHQHELSGAEHSCGASFEWSDTVTMYGYVGGMVPRVDSYLEGWRDADGMKMYKKVDMWHTQPFEKDEDSADRFEVGLPVQVLSCSRLGGASLLNLLAKEPISSLKNACKNNAHFFPVSKSLWVPSAKFAVAMDPNDVAKIRVPLAGENVSPIQAYGVAKRDSHPPAIHRKVWDGAVERIDLVTEEGVKLGGYVQGVWKQAVRDKVVFRDSVVVGDKCIRPFVQKAGTEGKYVENTIKEAQSINPAVMGADRVATTDEVLGYKPKKGRLLLL